MSGSIPTPDTPPGPVLVAVLAAGRATRFGGGKLDASCSGRPVGAWVLAAVAAAGLEPGICVTGPEAPQFLNDAPAWTRVVNPRPAEGLAGSLVAAAREAEARGAAALLVLLADMPLIEPALLAALAENAGPAATSHGGKPGVPALIPRALFPQLTEVSGDRGAARLLTGRPELVLLPAAPGTLLDVDTPDDLARAEARLMQVSGWCLKG